MSMSHNNTNFESVQKISLKTIWQIDVVQLEITTIRDYQRHSLYFYQTMYMSLHRETFIRASTGH